MMTELRTIKFQLMLAESEADAIDDWGRKQGTRSRADAIRQLCQIAMGTYVPPAPKAEEVKAGPSLLLATEVMRRLHISHMTLRRWMDDEGKAFPKPKRIGRRRFFHEADIKKWEEANE
jgi:predicted DNA-binding transcriptional regulator AlpA